MIKKYESLLRKLLVLSTTTLAAMVVAVGLPLKKALAASLGLKSAPHLATTQPQAKFRIIQPRFVNPSTVRLLDIADRALSNPTLAERIFRDPDAVAKQYHLTKNEQLVLRHMNQQQFQAARTDARREVAKRLAHAGQMRMPPGATNTRLITERMIVGRAILAAVGRSYLEAANAHDCCPWSKTIELGISSDPAMYNVVFQRQANTTAPRANVMQLQIHSTTPRTNVMRPQTQIKAMKPGAKILRPGVNLQQLNRKQ